MTLHPRIKAALMILMTAVLFAVLFRQIPFGKVMAVLRGADLGQLTLALLLTVLLPLFAAIRWRLILQLLGYSISLRTAFDLIMAAWPVSSITPSKSGDLIKAYYLKDRVPVGLTIGTVLVERAVDVLVLLLFSVAGAALFGWRQILWISGGLFCAGTLGLILLVTTGDRWPLPAKLRPKISDLLQAFKVLASHPAALILVVVYTVVKWFVSIFQTYLCFIALRHPVTLAQTAGALPLAIFVGLFPITLSGMGTRDGALVFLLSAYAPAEVILGVGLLYTLFAYWVPSLAGLPFLRRALPEGRSVLTKTAMEMKQKDLIAED
ncbi:MAG: flippase-like domain-containing protein [Candidatus Eisenbacteria bacterium]|uniref:Flippase-like domain-containing protein n=1 Tax=Eiseniibacteriota bacterium TaxID=2212470 RepID=A0A948W2G0_UNCEI|nr:flippase-like domain-containing protein [Candidatus Eisenbacteria bacterium]MBU1950026.1 flippase-like domain-containing protein [Candidatus Eisenbacteria bacterium]MBU2689902.1 flippase-like domain-containing protein [Candidatus Eisenbacteria bacterium]